jgi:hypothetical protein
MTRVGPQHQGGNNNNNNLIKYKVVSGCIIYIVYYILAYIQHEGDVSFENPSVHLTSVCEYVTQLLVR